jgi:hypothetical protein
VVGSCRVTSASEGGSKHRRGTPIYANAYAYQWEGLALEGVSYAPGRCLAAGTRVPVELLPDHPEISRIAGMRRAEFGPSVAFVAIFPLVGVVLLVLTLRAGARQVRLLRDGKLALGTFLGDAPTNVTVNRRRVYKVRLAIVTDRGVREEVEVRTSRPEVVEDDPQERILYDPADPRDALAWDLLPGSVAVDSAGQLRPANGLTSLRFVLPPALAVAAVWFALAIG